MDFVAQSRVVRSKYLGFIAEPLQKLGITANHLTLFSFLLGLAAVWFLFDNHFYFVLFGLLHLCFDSLDGVLARATKATAFGTSFDTLSDNVLVILLLVKSHAVFDNNVYALAAVLYALMLTLYFFSRARAPALFMRTVTFIGYFLQLFSLSALVVAVVTIIALFLQLRYHLTFFKPKK